MGEHLNRPKRAQRERFPSALDGNAAAERNTLTDVLGHEEKVTTKQWTFLTGWHTDAVTMDKFCQEETDSQKASKALGGIREEEDESSSLSRS